MLAASIICMSLRLHWININQVQVPAYCSAGVIITYVLNPWLGWPNNEMWWGWWCTWENISKVTMRANLVILGLTLESVCFRRTKYGLLAPFIPTLLRTNNSANVMFSLIIFSSQATTEKNCLLYWTGWCVSSLNAFVAIHIVHIRNQSELNSHHHHLTFT